MGRVWDNPNSPPGDKTSTQHPCFSWASLVVEAGSPPIMGVIHKLEGGEKVHLFQFLWIRSKKKVMKFFY